MAVSPAVNRAVTKALYDAGVGTILGTDAVISGPEGPAPPEWPAPGFGVHDELAELVTAGLTPYQALETATRNVAEFLGTLDSAGTVAVGKRADLVLLEADPLRDVRAVARVAGVMVGGSWLDRITLDRRVDSLSSPIASTSYEQSEYWARIRQARQRQRAGVPRHAAP